MMVAGWNPAAEAVEELERGGGDDHRDEHRGARTTNDEGKQRDRGHDRSGDHPSGKVVARRRNLRAAILFHRRVRRP